MTGEENHWDDTIGRAEDFGQSAGEAVKCADMKRAEDASSDLHSLLGKVPPSPERKLNRQKLNAAFVNEYRKIRGKITSFDDVFQEVVRRTEKHRAEEDARWERQSDAEQHAYNTLKSKCPALRKQRYGSVHKAMERGELPEEMVAVFAPLGKEVEAHRERELQESRRSIRTIEQLQWDLRVEIVSRSEDFREKVMAGFWPKCNSQCHSALQDVIGIAYSIASEENRVLHQKSVLNPEIHAIPRGKYPKLQDCKQYPRRQSCGREGNEDAIWFECKYFECDLSKIFNDPERYKCTAPQ